MMGPIVTISNFLNDKYTENSLDQAQKGVKLARTNLSKLLFGCLLQKKKKFLFQRIYLLYQETNTMSRI